MLIDIDVSVFRIELYYIYSEQGVAEAFALTYP